MHPDDPARRERFTDAFCAAWLASFSVSRYQDRIDRGDYDEMERHPAEDARHLAASAWEAYREALAGAAKGVQPSPEDRP